MFYKITFSRGANQDLTELYRYIAETLQNPASAEKIRADIIKKCHTLRLFPKASPVRGKIQGKRYRCVHCYKYTIIYTIDNASRIVEVRAIIYGSREIEKHISG